MLQQGMFLVLAVSASVGLVCVCVWVCAVLLLCSDGTADGQVLTPLGIEAWKDPAKRQPMMDSIPLGRFAEPEASGVDGMQLHFDKYPGIAAAPWLMFDFNRCCCRCCRTSLTRCSSC